MEKAAWLILDKDNFTGEWDNTISSVYTYDKFCMFYEYVPTLITSGVVHVQSADHSIT